MNALWDSYILRSLQKHVADAYTATAIYYEGQRADPARVSEWAVLMIDGPRWRPSSSPHRQADLTISIGCFCRLTSDVHRVREIAGAAVAALMRKTVTIYNYPADPASQVGGGTVRLFDAELAAVRPSEGHTGGGDEVPLMEATVVVDGLAMLTV